MKAERKRIESLDLNVAETTLLEACNHRLDYLELTRNKEYYLDQKRLSKKIIGYSAENGQCHCRESGRRCAVKTATIPVKTARV